MDKQNFILLLEQNKGIIHSLCKLYFSNTDNQKDAFQDIVLQLWKSCDSFRGNSKLTTWIYRVSLNTILNKLSSEQKSVSTEPLDGNHFSIASTGADDDVELLTAILKSLKDIDKAIVVLYLEGYRNKEIAEMLGLSITNISTRFNRIKSSLALKFNKTSCI